MQQGQYQRPRLHSQHSRGRPLVPRSHTGPPVSYGTSTQHLQLPSPWTGLQSQTGKPPVAMPVPKSQSQSSLRSGRKRTMVT
jgi:hypothetical protein